MRGRQLCKTVCVTGLLVASGPSFAFQYTVTHLGVLPGGNNMVGTALNGSGDAVGWSDFNSGQAFLWSDSELTNLGGIYAFGNYAYDINDSGQIAGVSANGIAVTWQDGVPTDIGHLPIGQGGTSNGHQAYGINNAGHVVGQSWTGPQYGGHPFLWTGTMVDMCPQGPQSAAVTINDLDVVAGTNCGGPGTGFVWNGYLTEVPITPAEINDAGWIAGLVNGPNSVQAAYWADGVVTVITPSSGGNANGLNELGQIVGSYDQGPDYSAFLWNAALGLRDLNDLIDPALGIYLRSAEDINDAGQILVNGRITVDEYIRDRAFLLTPQVVPIGPAGLFFASALGLMACARRRVSSTEEVPLGLSAR